MSSEANGKGKKDNRNKNNIPNKSQNSNFSEEERIRRIKESQTNQHRSGGSNKSNQKDTSPLPPPQTPDDQSEVITPQVVPHAIYSQDEFNFNFTTQKMCINRAEPPNFFPVGFEVKDKKLVLNAELKVGYLFQTTQVPGFEGFEFKYLGGDIIYSPLLLKILESAKSLPSLTSKNFTVLIGFLQSEFNSFDIQIRWNTCIVYAYLRSLTNLSLASTSLPMAKIHNTMLFFTSQYYHNGVIIEEEPQKCDFPNDWKFNGNFNVVKASNFKFSFDYETVLTYPEFTTTKLSKKKVYNFFRLIPSQPFTYYDTSGENITSALSRYFKARPDEELYRVNQISLLTAMETDQKFFDLIDAKYVYTGGQMEFYYKDFKHSDRYLHFGPSQRHRKKINLKPIDPIFRQNIDVLLERTGPTLNGNLFAFVLHLLIKVGWIVVRSVYNTYAISINAMLAVVSYVYDPFYYLYDKSDWLKSVVKLPAPKRRLYELWLNDEFHYVKYIHNEFLWESKIKWEPGKYKKAARLYASAGAACLYDKIAPEVAKKAFCETIKWQVNSINHECKYYVAQDKESSDECYRWLLTAPPNTSRTAYFSDDSLLTYNDGEQLHIKEIDISGCDASNGVTIFAIAFNLISRLSTEEIALALVGQCSKNTKIINPSDDSEFVILTPQSFFEYSGSLLTTLLNNIATYLIITAFSSQLVVGGAVDEAIINGAKLTGHVVTINPVNNINQATFLKRAYDGVNSYLVLGTILRSLGSVDTLITAATLGVTHEVFKHLTDEGKMTLRVVNVLNGLVNEPGNLILNALRQKFGVLAANKLEISLQSLIDRYGGQEYEWYGLSDAIYGIELGIVISHPILDLIYHRDYGVTPGHA